MISYLLNKSFHHHDLPDSPRKSKITFQLPENSSHDLEEAGHIWREDPAQAREPNFFQASCSNSASSIHSADEMNLQQRVVAEIMAKYRNDSSSAISIFPCRAERTSTNEFKLKKKWSAPRKGSEQSAVVVEPLEDEEEAHTQQQEQLQYQQQQYQDQQQQYHPSRFAAEAANQKMKSGNQTSSTSLDDPHTPKSGEYQQNERGFFSRFKKMLNPRRKRFFLNTLDFTANLLLAQPKFNQKFFASVISSISFKTFQKCIGGDVEKVIKQNEDSHEKKMANLGDKQDYSHIKLDHLIYIKKLGFGQFGTVYLVRNKDNGALYALKSVSKNQIIEQNLEKHLLQEKQVLESVNFTFIMQFLRTFKDNQSVYFLVEFISGMELFDVIRDIGLLSTQDSQFYIGTLILCMEYLHSRSIIYRDIKPENIMVDSKGYMYMIDMGTAKILKQTKHPGRTFTIIGTPHYMAPEIIQGKGYSYAADLWSVGICLYEFLCGGVPYAEEAEDPYEIYEEIIKRNSVRYPSSLKDKKAKRLIDQLLSKIPELRLGGSFAALKAHPWFDNFNWDDLYSKKMQPPYIPPDNKIVHEKDILQIAKEGKLVINEIKKEQEKSKQYNKDKARDPNWDKDF